MHPDVIGGRYRVGTAIGQGGMGTVWLCRDETLRRDVAIKQVGMLPGESVTDSARALREARSSAALSHRNVVTVFDVVEEDGFIWLVMEHVPSRSLADIIKEDGPLDPYVVTNIGAQVADGLAAAHAVGTMHRDVKPGNVLIREDGVAKISDFGIARSAGDPALTQSGFLTGTPAYFSPEIARGVAPEPSADVWALGATLYAAVEGRPPYRLQANPVAVLHDIASQQPPPPTRAAYLEPVLLRLMDRDPRSRWSMDDAAHALHRLAREHAPENTRANTLGVSPATLAQRTPEPAKPTSKRSLKRSRKPTPVPVPAPVPASADEPADEAAPVSSPDRTGQSSTESSTESSTGRSPEPSSSYAATAAPPRAPSRDEDEDQDQDEPRRHRGAYAVLLLVALLLVAGGILYVVSRGGGSNGSGDTAGSSSSTSASPAGKSSSSSSASETPSASPSSSPSTSATAQTGAGDKASFLRGYFQAAPGGTDAAWAQLGPGEKAQGRASYNGFWRGIESVGVSNIKPVRGTDSVDVTLTYRKTDGTTSTERQRLDLIKSSEGGYLINNDDPVG